ncbi:MAG: hypothetical protein JXA52_07725 [Planctomycetes bacterium]|nr:hypothetical protein [Planctomycetota bacterium]
MRLHKSMMMLTLALLLLSCSAFAAQSLTLQPGPVETEAFFTQGQEPTFFPKQGTIGLLCIADCNTFAIADLKQVTLLDQENKPLPLTIESSTIFKEFDEISELTFCCIVPAESVSEDSRFVLQWGEDIEGENATIEKIILNPQARNRYRRLRLATDDAAAASSAGSLGTIMVIADKNADFYFLWYLLPIACILVLLLIGKARSHKRISPVRT